MADWTSDSLLAELNHLGKTEIAHLHDLVTQYGKGIINLSTLLAVASRETGMRNIEGDFGHGKGMFQVDDRSFENWLRSQAGCRSGTHNPVRGHTAADPGFVPTITAGAIHAIQVELLSAHDYASRQGYKDVGKFMLSAYNAGIGGASAGLRAHNDSDFYTTGKDYGADVLARHNAIHGLLVQHQLV